MGSPKFARDGKCKDSPRTVPSHFSDWLTVRLEFYLFFNQNSAITFNDHFAWHLLSPKPDTLGLLSRRTLGLSTAHIDWEAGDLL